MNTNRRKTVVRSFRLSRLWAPSRNRRLKQKKPSTARRPMELKALCRSAARLGLSTLKVALFAGAIAGIGWGGHYGYRRVMASTTFCIKQIAITGEKHAPQGEIVRLVESCKGKNIFTIDLDEVKRAIQSHPWIKEAKVRRELPSGLHVEVVEQEPRAALLLGHLYLVNAKGEVFKRASVDEADGLAVITGLDRLAYLNNPTAEGERIRRALDALDRYRAQARPPLSEVNIGQRGEITYYLRQGGAALRLGNELSDERLARFDRVWAVLGPEAARARVLFLDHEVRADRVIVRLGSNH